MQILLVEDDQPTSAVLAASLRAQHYQVSTAFDGAAGLELAQQFEYDLILLDLELPKLGGIGLCQALRDQSCLTPILLLTAREGSTNLVLGLDSGADDYMIKPFDLAELLARVRALLRRAKATPATAALMTWNNLCLDLASHEARVDQQVLHLTPKEYALLELFLSKPHRVFSRSAILDRLWNPAEAPGEETVSTHIKCLRQKLKAAGVANPIKTLHGIGYRLRSPAELEAKAGASDLLPPPKQVQDLAQSASSAQSGALTVLDSPPRPTSAAEKAQTVGQEITTRVWLRSAHRLKAQIATIEQAVTALSQHCLPPEQQQQAAEAAHRLAGSLGIFGLQVGSELARQLEDWLQPQILLDEAQIVQLQDWVQALQCSLSPLWPTAPTAPTAPAMPRCSGSQTSALPLILLILSDAQLSQQLIDAAPTWGLCLERATPQTAQAQRCQSRPDAILLDLDWPQPEPGLALLKQLMQPDRCTDLATPQPTLVLSCQDSLQNRLTVAELGGVFLQKPVALPQIFHAITHILECRLRQADRVMVVDDDPTVLSWISDLLQPLEIKVTGIGDPEQFWPTLQSSSPDLLILDIELPLLKGWQLCQMLRRDLEWQHLPILFLSNHSDPQQIDQAFQAGADDYFSKSNFHQPSGTADLVERILRRLKRASQHPGQAQVP